LAFLEADKSYDPNAAVPEWIKSGNAKNILEKVCLTKQNGLQFLLAPFLNLLARFDFPSLFN
jgi:hypothetical protein